MAAAPTFVERLAEDGEFPLDHEAIYRIVANPNPGLAAEQARRVVERITVIAVRYPEAAKYNPEEIR